MKTTFQKINELNADIANLSIELDKLCQQYCEENALYKKDDIVTCENVYTGKKYKVKIKSSKYYAGDSTIIYYAEYCSKIIIVAEKQSFYCPREYIIFK